LGRVADEGDLPCDRWAVAHGITRVQRSCRHRRR
jgi:hypothetical protein